MTSHLVELAIEIILLYILYRISKQEQRITVLEYKNEPNLSADNIREAIKQLKSSKVDTFVDKIAAEEKRMNKLTNLSKNSKFYKENKHKLIEVPKLPKSKKRNGLPQKRNRKPKSNPTEY